MLGIVLVNEYTYTSWALWLTVKSILPLFTVQLPKYSIAAYQSYHSKKVTKTQNQTHSYNSTPEQLHF